MVSHQEKSEIYWKNTSNSHLAAPEYYEKKKKILEVIISHIPAAHSTLDIGCGNGEYTAMFLPKSEKIVGYDISPGLLDVARQKFRARTQNDLSLCNGGRNFSRPGKVQHHPVHGRNELHH